MPANQLPNLSLIFIVIALVMFAMGAWSRWWAADPHGPFYGSFVSAGLFFWCLSTLFR